MNENFLALINVFNGRQSSNPTEPWMSCPIVLSFSAGKTVIQFVSQGRPEIRRIPKGLRNVDLQRIAMFIAT